ncbi:MAG: hypothetical protein FNP40_09095 [Dehalobacter sp. 4CP]|nr:hypothetical protein [Dehalobacter sp. 4CP]
MGRCGGLEGIAGHESGGEAAVLWRRWEAMKKGKSRTRNARIDIMRANAANARRRARKYDKQAYDRPCGEEQ